MSDLRDLVDHSLREWNFERFYDLPETPHYSRVPKDYESNKKFRKRLFKLGASSPQRAKEIWQLCKQDILFWVNSFCYTYSPKDYPDDPHRLFITYPYQDDALLRISRAITEQYDLPIVKSRDMGATWFCLLALRWRWQFLSGQAFLIASRKMELVDSKMPRSLFWKLDYLDKRMPSWMLPSGREAGDKDINRTKGHLENAENGSVIDGEATVPDMGRGDRLTAVFKDESAFMDNADKIDKATRDATNVRIDCSTPNGTSGDGAQFYEMCHRNIERTVVLWWPLHPEKALGLYRAHADGTLDIMDPSYDYPKDYKFIRDGRLRSIWYDIQWERAGSESEMAQEVDLDFARSGSPFFSQDLISELEQEARDPDFMCEVVEDAETKLLKLTPQPGGRISVWIPELESDPTILQNEIFVVSCDIAAGTGGGLASNSTATVYWPSKGRKVAEFASNTINPAAFGNFVVTKLCTVFNKAFLIWESNGYGLIFGKEVVEELGYSRVYWNADIDRLDAKQTKKPGWHSTKDKKRYLLSSYADALKSRKFKNPSKPALQECREYVHGPNGTIVHDKSRMEIDTSTQGENHGDRVIADALGWHFGKDYANLVREEEKTPLNHFSMAGRRDIRQTEKLTTGDW